jgi:gliding motility-associated-like protein
MVLTLSGFGVNYIYALALKMKTKASKSLNNFLFVFFILCSSYIKGQTLTISDNGDAGTSGANWSTSGANPVIISATGDADIKATVIRDYLNDGKSVTLESSGNIEVSSIITKTSNNTSSLTLKATGNIIVNNSNSIKTNGGHIILWANSDSVDDGYVTTGQNVVLDSRQGTATTGGGHIYVGGGDDTNNDGFPDNATAGSGNFDGGAAYGILFGNAAGSGVQLLSGGGNITLKGGIDASFTDSRNSHGIGFFPGYIIHANAGNISFNGAANHGGAATVGIDLMTYGTSNASSIMTSGDLTLYGESTVTSVDSHRGVSLEEGLTINAGTISITGSSEDNSVVLRAPITSTGSVSVHADGGNLLFEENLSSDGDILLRTTNNFITSQTISQTINSNNNNISIIADSDANAPGNGDITDGLLKLDYFKLISGVGDILIRGDTFQLLLGHATPKIESTTGSFTLEPSDTSFYGSLGGGAVETGWFIFPNTLSGFTIGKPSNTRGINLSNSMTVAGPISIYGGDIKINNKLEANGSTITLDGSGNVTDEDSGYILANKLALLDGTIILDNSNNNVATIAANDVDAISYIDEDGLEIGTVGSLNGITSTAGVINVATLTGNLTVSKNVNTTSNSNDAIILNAGRTSAAGTLTGGDIIINGSPLLTYGSGGRTKLFSGSDAQSTNLTDLVGIENTRRGFDEVSQPTDLTDNNTYAIYRSGNTSPSVISSSVTSATAQSLYLYDIKSSDPENDLITWTAITIPDWLTFSSNAFQTNFLGTGVRPNNTGDGINQSTNGVSASNAVITAGTAVHGNNKLFFTDIEEYGVRYVDTNGDLQTWYQGDGTYYSLNPVGIAYDALNDAVYIGDYSKSDILKIDNTGAKTLLSNLPESFMFRMLLHSNGSNLYVSARGGIYEIDLNNNNPATNYRRVVGTGRFGYSDTGRASTSQVFFPHGMAFDSSGRLVFTDRHNDIIRRVNLSEDTIETIAGVKGQGVESGDGGLAINATFSDPTGLVINDKDEIFISERLSKRIRKIDSNGSIDEFFRVASGGFADDLVISTSGELYLLTSNLVAQVATKAEIIGTPTNTDVGTHNVALILSDGLNNTSYNFDITVVAKSIGATVRVIDNLTNENGGTGSFSIVLDSQPTADVTINLNSSNTGEGTISASSLTFTQSNWNTPQIIMVTGVDDDLADGSQEYQIITANVTSSDVNYNALDGKTINNAGMINEDNDPDTDGDGREDPSDAFPEDPTEDTDTDGDGTGDNADTSPSDPNINGDVDGDGVTDPFDLCPNTPVGAAVNSDGCAASQRDTDGDGINDDLDNCVTTANADQADADGDGIGDVCDNAPNTPNADQADTDGDGTPDVLDEDDDNDGCLDAQDDLPLDASECSDKDGDGIGDNADTDNDNDGVLNILDNCEFTPNSNQLDTDSDGIGNVCDSDDDNDGFSDVDEITCGTDPLLASSMPLDTDNDGIANCMDTDDDNDGFSDTDEATCGSDPLNATSKPLDTDNDGTPNCIDTDDDNDSYLDENDAFPLDASEWLDTDADGLGNNADTDDDGDGQLDTDEITCGSDPLDASSMSLDTDADGIPDCVDTDDDGDGVLDTNDAFPVDETEWTDTDADGIGNNADTDDDGDGFSDLDELSCNSDPLNRFSKPSDMDNDGIPDCLDTDRDGDGVLNTQDVFPDDPNESVDTDGDGLGDNFEVDDDNDGILDINDAFPLDPNEWADADGDGIGDNADPDDNNDGFNDSDLIVSGALTPNSSGLESTWKIINIDKYPNARVQIYNKSGQEVFNKLGYKNDWRGTFNNGGEPLPAGSYYYMIDLNNGSKALTGWLYITY